MGIELYFSNRLEELAGQFLRVVDREWREKENLLKGPLTLVPNQNLAKWLQLTMARHRPVCMNVDFDYLESGLWRLIAALDRGSRPPERMDIGVLRMLLLRALDSMDPRDKASAPFSEYLFGPSLEKGPDYPLKLWQLVEKMARLFEEYEYHRSDMMEGWVSGDRASQGMEACQQGLYLRIRTLRDALGRATSRRLLSLKEYAHEILLQQGPPPAGQPKPFVHLFGLSQVSPTHLHIMDLLRHAYDVHVYVLNPSREFWEDIQTPRERKWIERRRVRKLEVTPGELEAGELQLPEGSGLLGLWGKPGRENIRLLCQLTDYDFHACFHEEAPSSLLKRLQDRILRLPAQDPSRNPPQDHCPQDASLQIVACPSIFREVETVYHSILFNLEQDPTLQLTQVAVLVPDMGQYKPVIDAVFQREPRRLVYNLVDARADMESLYGQAVLGLLSLARGRFSRRAFFEVVGNPCFLEMHGIGPEEMQIWIQWAEALQIFHGFDAPSKKKSGYGESDRYSWKQGLQRLRLSRIMAPPHEGGQDRFQHVHGLTPFSDVNTGDGESLERFSLLMERVHGAVRDLANVTASGREWGERIRDLCHAFLTVPSGRKGEAEVRQSLLEALLLLRIYDQIPVKENDEVSAKPGLSLSLVQEFVQSSLRSISGSHGDYLTDGVTLSALQPMRPIPFRIVYVLGMQEGAFPGKAETSSLDLRLLKRRIGDVTFPERNQYLFLEMLLSVRDKLYLSYLARDLQKDCHLTPCSVVNQLRGHVEQEILPPGQSFSITEVPLRGSSERYLAPAVDQGVSDVLGSGSLIDHVAYYRETGLWDRVMGQAPERIRSMVERYSPDFSLGILAREDQQVLEKISARHLRRFLEEPVRHALARHLGIYEEEETPEILALREDEPFFTEFPADYQIRMETLRLWMERFLTAPPLEKGVFRKRNSFQRVFEQVYEGFWREGKTPEGAFATLDRETLRQDVLERMEVLWPVLGAMHGADEKMRAVFLGAQTQEGLLGGTALPIRRLAPLKLGIRSLDPWARPMDIQVELHGELPWIWKDRKGEWHALVLTGAKAPGNQGREPDKYVLEPLLFWMIFLDSEPERTCWTITLHVAYREDLKTWSYTLAPEVRKAYLDALLHDYLRRDVIEWLPFKAVTSAAMSIKPYRPREQAVDEQDKKAYCAELADALEEETSHLIRVARPRIPEDAFDRVRSRFEIFFDVREDHV